MNQLQQDIVNYFNNYNKKLNNSTILLFEDEIQKIYDRYESQLSPLTDKQISFIHEIYNKNRSYGGFTYITKQKIFVNNINKFEFDIFYPKTINLLYKCGFITHPNIESYSYLIDNYNLFKTIFSNNEITKFNFNFIINSLYPRLKTNNVSGFCNSIMLKILNSDTKKNIVYIDTDLIYYHNALDLNVILGIVDGLYEYNIDNIDKNLYLAREKKYILFNSDDPNVHKCGMICSSFYKDKKIKDIAYDYYLNNNVGATYNDFYNYFSAGRNSEYRKNIINTIKTNILRKEKLKSLENEYNL